MILEAQIFCVRFFYAYVFTNSKVKVNTTYFQPFLLCGVCVRFWLVRGSWAISKAGKYHADTACKNSLLVKKNYIVN